MADEDSTPDTSNTDEKQQEPNAYELRQAARRERYEDRAAEARRQSSATLDHARRMASVIPFGQPILVGHHSEKGDRNYRARIDRTYGKGFELMKKADYYDARAESVGKGGISSDDPAAVVKLRDELTRLEEHHALMVATNKAHKDFQRDPATLDRSTLADAIKEKIRSYKPAYSWEPHPIPPYRLTNNSANMRRIRQRIEALQHRPTESTEQVIDVPNLDGEGRYKGDKADIRGINGGVELGSTAVGSNEPLAVTLREDVAENRVMLIFPGKPPEAVRAILKGSGFKWSPTRGAWVRFLNSAGRSAAQYVLTKIKSRNGV